MFMAVPGKQGSGICRRYLRPVYARVEDAFRLSLSASKTPLPVRVGDNLLASLSRKRRRVLFCFCALSSCGHPGLRKPFSSSAYTVLPSLRSTSTTLSCHFIVQVRSAQVLPYFRRPFASHSAPDAATYGQPLHSTCQSHCHGEPLQCIYWSALSSFTPRTSLGIWYTWHCCTFSPASRPERGRRRFYVSPHWRSLAVPRFTLLMGFPVGCKLPFVYPQFLYMIGFVPDNWTNCLASVLSVMRFRCLDVVVCIRRDRDWLRRGHPDRGTDAWSLACSRGHRGPAACVYHGSRITCRSQ